MTLLQAILTAILQGVTELFPVSSLGHAVIMPHLFGWQIDQEAPEFLPFLVVLHLGTATALLLYFWREWAGFAKAVLHKPHLTDVLSKRPADRRVFFLLCIATLPAVIFGFLLQHKLRLLFAKPSYVAIFLIVNGFILFVGERIKKAGHKNLDQLNWKMALAIGAAQALALLPGISRSGITMVGGILAGLKHADAARFSFLLATPVICGAAVLEVPKLFHSGASMGWLSVVAGVVAGVAAYLSIALMMRYFKKHEFEALDPFAWYCWALGALTLFVVG